MKKKLFLLFLLTAAFATTLVTLRAQQGNPGISVAPSNFDLTLNPGDTITRVIRVTNNTEHSLFITPKLRNFTARGEEGGVAITKENSTYSISAWTTVSPEASTIEAHRTREFTFTLHAPQNAEPGGHFGSIVFASTPPEKLNQTGAAVAQEVASLLLVRVTGNVTEKATAESFTTNQSFYEFGPVLFDLRVKNEGGVHIRPAGDILITNMFGQKTTIPLNGQNVLPNAIRKMDTTWDRKLLVGRYTATLISSYGSKNEQLEASTIFYAFPLRYGAVAFMILLIIFLLRKRLGKALKTLITGK